MPGNEAFVLGGCELACVSQYFIVLSFFALPHMLGLTMAICIAQARPASAAHLLWLVLCPTAALRKYKYYCASCGMTITSHWWPDLSGFDCTAFS